MGIGGWFKKKMQTWLEIIPPPTEQAIVIQCEHTRELEVLRSQLWYQGDANELFQFFHQTETNTGAFWATAPATSKIRKIHSGLPAVMADTLAYIVSSDLDGIEAPSEWDEIAQKIDFKKHDGSKHLIELSKQYSLYRQDYCGCVYSKANRQKEKETS